MSSSYIPETPPRSHRKHKKSTTSYATPKTPFHHDLSADYRVSNKTNLLKTPSSLSSGKPFTVYQTPVTPKSASKRKNDIITPPPSVHHQDSFVTPVNGRLLFPANPGRIGSGRSHHKTLKAPSLTTLLNMAAESSASEAEEPEEDVDDGPRTPSKQMMTTPSAPPKKFVDDEEIELCRAPAPKTRNPFVTAKDDGIKNELVYVDRFGRTKVEKLDDEEARLLQKTKRKLTFN